MKCKEAPFRAFYKRFTALPLTDGLRSAIEKFPGAAEANCVLTYGYIDSECGLTLEVIAASFRDEKKGFMFADTNPEVRSVIRIGTVADSDFYYFPDEDGTLAKRYADKIAALKTYDADEEVEQTRTFAFLDDSRDSVFPDDVLVYLLKEGKKPEGCWTRIIGIGDHFFMGNLLNEPDQDFGFHKGERIAFFVRKDENDRVVCCADLTPDTKLTAKDLEDGSMLEKAAETFTSERNEDNFISLLELLRDCNVWVPCNAVLSEEDYAQLDKMVEDAGDDLESIKGQTLNTLGETRLVPNILQNGEELFFPIFSTPEAMGEYGDHFSKICMPMLNVIAMARGNDRPLAGIVLNAFTNPFVLDAQVWDIVENMKSRLTEE